MARVKGGMTARRRKKKIFKLAKGNFGGRKNRNRMAQETVQKGLFYAYRDRKQRKREFRSLWIVRVGAAARLNGLSYTNLMEGLKKAKILLNRKMLSEVAIHDTKAFAQIAEIAKKQLARA